MDLTVLICTYNRAPLLARSLEHVAAQAVRAPIGWDVIVVDNNCTDATAEVVGRFARDPRIPGLTYLREPRQGVAFARRRGLMASRSELVAFVDDDCLLAPDWIDQAWQFARAHPRAGAFGGRNTLLWEAPPPALAERYAVSLAGQDFGDRPQRMPSAGRRYPVGAGLVLRREAVLASRWIDTGMLTSRRAERLTSGEDSEICLRVRHAGWELWYVPQLALAHYIPHERTTLVYLRRLHRGFGQAEAFLRALSRVPSPAFRDRLASAFWAVGELGRVLARWPRGYVQYAAERPTWLIRLSWARGCLEGAARFLLTGRAS